MDRSPRWSELLPFTQHVLNTTTHTETGFSPHELLYGRRAEIGHIDLTRLEKADEAESATVKDTQQYLTRLRETQEMMDELNPTRVVPCEGQDVEPGSLVLLQPVRKNKLQGLEGPFKVLRTLSNKAVEIASLVEDHTKVVHESKLMRFDADISDEEARRLQASDYMEYVVQEVLGHNDTTHELHISWDGYAETTWEPVANVKRVAVVQQYLKQHRIRWKAGRG